MFLDCPACLDQDGAARCGLPAEVRCRYTMRSTDGPVQSAMIRQPCRALVQWARRIPHLARQAAAGSGCCRSCAQTQA
jgi:hypothetical protein